MYVLIFSVFVLSHRGIFCLLLCYKTKIYPHLRQGGDLLIFYMLY